MNGFPITAPGVNVAVVRKTDRWEFLLLTRATSDTYPDRTGLLGGTREGSESIEALATRELFEETGLQADHLWLSEYLTTFFEPASQTVCQYPVLIAEVSPAATVRLDAENRSACWLSAESAAKRVSWRNLAELIVRIEDDLLSYPPKNWTKLR